MQKVQIYHNPKCSKSRKTLEILENLEIELEIIEYLKATPSKDKLNDICKKLGLEAQEIIRDKDGLYKDLGKQELLQTMANSPELIERPIVVSGNKAVIGRPPENVHKIILE
jgi:arsenate reductase